jgi:hypothetical protein
MHPGLLRSEYDWGIVSKAVYDWASGKLIEASIDETCSPLIRMTMHITLPLSKGQEVVTCERVATGQGRKN